MTRTYITWCNMKQRCLNANRPDYKYYGGRGIKVCDRWLKFKNFYEDMGERPIGMSLDRIENSDGYTKENCKWSSPTEQNNNKTPILKKGDMAYARVTKKTKKAFDKHANKKGFRPSELLRILITEELTLNIYKKVAGK
jgi:hypothetical protein